jgi:large subunit ribosomal protein L25
MELLKVEAQRRARVGKGIARKLRRAGEVPGVVYGLGQPPQPLVVSGEQVERLRRLGPSTLVELYLDGQPPAPQTAAIVKAVQHHPVTRQPLAIDFQWVALTETVEVEVPVVIVGRCPGVEKGGVLEQFVHEVTVRCLPTQIPEAVQADVSGLDLGQTLHAHELAAPEGVEILTDPEVPVIHVGEPRGAEEAEAEVAEAGEEVAAELSKEKEEGEDE